MTNAELREQVARALHQREVVRRYGRWAKPWDELDDYQRNSYLADADRIIALVQGEEIASRFGVMSWHRHSGINHRVVRVLVGDRWSDVAEDEDAEIHNPITVRVTVRALAQKGESE